MIIKSNFRDYYDHIAHIYGGGDPKIVYVRPYKQNIADQIDIRREFIRYAQQGHRYYTTLDDQWKTRCDSVGNAYDLYGSYFDGRNDYNPEVRGIVVGDIFFTQIKMKSDEPYRLVKKSDIKEPKYSWWGKGPQYSDYINHKDETLIALCRIVGSPVFMFNTYRNSIIIHDMTPKLGEIGVASFISANEMYQHLSYFVGNVMKESPDMMPEIKIDDKYKIMGHGFDLKTSFRGKV